MLVSYLPVCFTYFFHKLKNVTLKNTDSKRNSAKTRLPCNLLRAFLKKKKIIQLGNFGIQ